MKVTHVNHIGIVVHDLEQAKQFFLDLGFSLAGETTVEGEWVGKIIGLGDVRSDIVMLEAPDGEVNIELSKYHRPEAIGETDLPSNVLGLRHIAFEVENLQGIVDTLQQKGRQLIGEIQTYENSWKLCYINGPEGIIIELAEQLSSELPTPNEI